MSERGKYIVIEGNDGTGKSSQVQELRRRLGVQGISSIEIHEPDGVPIAAELRPIIKNANLQRDPWSNVLLFTVARRLNWLQAMQPALEKGTWVLAARNWVSTAVYQGYGEGVDLASIKDRTRADVGDDYLVPDLALILSLKDSAQRQSRISGRGELDNPDTFESRGGEFQSKLEDGYERFAKDNGIEIIDASPAADIVAAEIWKRVKPLTGESS